MPERFEIPILRYTKIDLSIFDFSEYDLKIIDIESQEFDDYILKLNNKFYSGNISFFNTVKEEIILEDDKKYAIIKNNPLIDFDRNSVYKVYNILLILFPSALQIQYSVHFRIDDDFVQRTKMVTLTNEYEIEDNYLNVDSLSISKIDNINKLIKKIYPTLNYGNYIGFCFENYYNSFTASHLHFSYITLCMSLENLVAGPQELSYRLKRIASLLIGDTKDNAIIIFNNLTKIYNLRSKIVHGETYTSHDILDKINYLRGVVSRIIVELLIHNIDNNKLLNEIITTLGYGQKDLISSQWEFYELNNINSYDLYDNI